MVSKFYDVIISGAGMVGTALACAFAKSPKMSGKKILLLDAGPLKLSQVLPTEKYSNRVSALSPSTKSFMQNVGVWDNISKNRFQPVKKMQVWDACSDAMIAFNCPNVLDDVAYIVENKLVRESFLTELAKLKETVEIQDSSRVAKYLLPSTNGETARVHLTRGDVYDTRLLIGADGFKSGVRDAMDINYINFSYEQIAIVATLHLSEADENNIAWQRFLPDSTIALLPLSNSRSSLVWSTSTAHAKALLKMDEISFVASINDALWNDTHRDSRVESMLRSFSGFLDRVIPAGQSVRQLPPNISGMDSGSISGFMLGFGHASNYVAPRVALVGDAAHRVHPHAGLGLNLGFGDVQSLVKTVEKAIYSGADIGSVFQLTDYESERQAAVVPLLVAIDCLHRSFSTNFPPSVITRSIGIQALNYMQPIKQFLMKQTSR